MLCSTQQTRVHVTKIARFDWSAVFTASIIYIIIIVGHVSCERFLYKNNRTCIKIWHDIMHTFLCKFLQCLSPLLDCIRGVSFTGILHHWHFALWCRTKKRLKVDIYIPPLTCHTKQNFKNIFLVIQCVDMPLRNICWKPILAVHYSPLCEHLPA